MSTARQIVEQGMGLSVTGERERQIELYAPDAVVEFPLAPAGVPDRFSGREEILAMWRALDATRGDLEIVREETSVTAYETNEPGTVVIELDAKVVVQDEPHRLRQVHVYVVRDGLISQVRDYWGGPGSSLIPGALRPLAR